MTAGDVIAQATPDLNDSDRTRWSIATLIAFINDGQRAIVLLRPEAYSTSSAVILVAGTKQAAPTGTVRVLDMPRNMGSDGATPGAAIRVADRGQFDNLRPNWHSEKQQKVVKNFMLDDRLPNVFYVYPPADAVTPPYVELVRSVLPTDATAEASALSLTDIWMPALVRYVLNRCFSIDTESASSMQRAQLNLQAFSSLLGGKAAVDVAASPNNAAAR